MIMKCQVCNYSGGNMKKCKKCGMIWCSLCAQKGKGHYPMQKYSNKCPYCGALDQIQSA